MVAFPELVLLEIPNFDACITLICLGRTYLCMYMHYFTLKAILSAMKRVCVGSPFRPNLYPAAYTCKLLTCFDHHSILLLGRVVCVPSVGQRLNVGSSPTVGAVFSAMKIEYVVVADYACPLGPAYSFHTKKYMYPTMYLNNVIWFRITGQWIRCLIATYDANC